MDDAAHVGDAEPARDVEPDPGDVARAAARPTARRRAARSSPSISSMTMIRPGRVGAGVEARDDVPMAEDGGRQRLAPEAVGEVAVGADLAVAAA